MKKSATVAAITAMVFGVGACASDPEWESEEQKREVFARYVRDTALVIKDFGDDYLTRHAAERARTHGTREDRMKAEAILSPPNGESESHSEPRTIDPSGDGVCEGWVWDRHLDRSEERSLESFTAEWAVETGYL